jgi:hypothetical protein
MIRLSKHITDEMGGRSIRLEYIEATLATPDHVTADPTDAALSRSFKAIPEFANRVLRVVHRPDGNNLRGGDIFVVTAHWDRGAKLP